MTRIRPLLSFLLIFAFAVSAKSTASAAPVPEVTFDSYFTGDTLIGSTFDLEITFDNTAAIAADNAGYAPFIDVYFPVNGADGAAGTSLPLDGVDYVTGSATYLNVSVEETVLTFPDAPLGGVCDASESAVSHPYAVDNNGAAITVCGTPADKLVVFRLPFSSFTPEQPAATVHFQATLHEYADAGSPLTLFARGGFAFGLDPLNNPLTDPSVLSDASPATMSDNAAGVINPTPIKLKKKNSATEDEVATGPNNPQTYTVKIKVAPGQTIANLDVTDYLDDNVVITNVDAPGSSNITLGGAAPAFPAGPLEQNGTANELVVSYASISADTEFMIEYYVPLLDFSGTDIVNPGTAAETITENRANALGDWTPTDPRDSAGADNASAGDPDCPTCDPLVMHSNQAIAIQKSVENLTDSKFTPGDTLRYTLNIQVSDFFALDDVYVYDLLHDGLRLSSVPQISIVEHGFTYDGAIDSGNYEERQYFTGGTHSLPDFNVPEAAAGDTVLFFDISSEVDYRLSYPVLGGCVPATGTGGGAPDCGVFDEGQTTIIITYEAVIQDSFADDYPSGDASVDEGDKLQNKAYIEAQTILDVSDLTPNGETSEANDETEECFIIEKGYIEKTIFAHTDAETSTVTYSPADLVEVTPGDLLTFRLRYYLSSSDFEDFAMYDYLPLPILDANEVTAFNNAVSDGTTLPVAGAAMWGPTGETDGNTNYHAVNPSTPAITTPGGTTPAQCGSLPIDASENYLHFCFGSVDDINNTEAVVDILFTITVTDFPFQDNAVLNNLAVASLGSTNNGSHLSASLVRFTLRQPNLVIRKGIVDTTASDETFTETPNNAFVGAGNSAAPAFTGAIESALGGGNGEVENGLNADASDITAGAIVRYAITVQNTGGSPAFDVSLSDTLPAGWTCNAATLNFNVAWGNGTAAAYTPLGSSDPCDFFTNFDANSADGIVLTDGSSGLLASPDEDPASAVLVVTYDLEVPLDALPDSTHTNTATLISYAGVEGAQNHLDLGGARTDTATVSILYIETNSLTFQSNGNQDGWALESSENSNTGGKKNNTAKTLRVGDDAFNRQYRSVLSFNTAAIPDGANITRVTLLVKRSSSTGGNLFKNFQGLMVDVRKGNFGKPALQLADFKGSTVGTYGPFTPPLILEGWFTGWYMLDLTPAAARINDAGNTQLRLRFNLDDNNNFTANFLNLHSGNAASANRPQLIVEYGNP
jgi:large repetitive protein